MPHSSQFKDRLALIPSEFLISLLFEVINNGFESDLMPIINSETKRFEFDFKQFVKDYNVKDVQSRIYFDKVKIPQLCQYYGIFSILKQKMQHTRHKEMNNVLKVHEMFAMILYCNGDCNYDLSKWLRQNPNETDYHPKKWATFDECLWYAIQKLSTWETYDLFIYSGVCNIKLNQLESRSLLAQSTSESINDGFISFRTHHSFSTDLTVAKEFAGSDGMIIAIRLHPNRNRNDLFSCCSMSWISKYSSESEVLVRKGSTVFLSASNIAQIGNRQLVICSVDPLEGDMPFADALLHDIIHS